MADQRCLAVEGEQALRGLVVGVGQQARVVEAGRKHATEQIAAADQKAKEGAREDARKILALLIDQLGTSSEFENQVQLAKVKYDALK